MADNCEPRKIDSNATGLSFAETICGRLPTIELDGYLPTWFELEPNSYSDFGGELTSMARAPINASRQRKKGVPVDFDAGGGFNQDFTQTNFNRLLQGFFFADAREKATTKPLNADQVVVTGVTGGAYTAAAGLSRFRVGALVKVSGFLNAQNNGVKLVTAVTDTTVTVGAIDDEVATDEVVIETVGFQLGAGLTNIGMIGTIGNLTSAGAMPVAATGTIELTDNPAIGETVTVGGVEYTFASAIVAAYDVLIGGDLNATAANLAASLNGNVLGTPANPYVTATAATDTVTVTARVRGTGGNLIALAEATDATLSGATLSGGTGFSYLELGLTVGEWVYVGGDDLSNRFVNNVGYARVSVINDLRLSFDKTTWEPETEVGAGKSIRVFIGTTIRNEKDPELVTTRYYEFERTLGKDADGVQSEYLRRSVANELTLNMPLADKLNADVSFVSSDTETRTGAEGRKPGPFIAAPGEDAYNTSSNIIRARMAVIDPATSRPLPLFAYMTEGNIAINNNVSPVKVIGSFGGIDVSLGNFEVGGEFTAVFSTVLAIRAIRNNADVTLDFIAAAQNAGFVWDIPLLSLGGGALEIEAGEPVTMTLTPAGAENPNGYTLLYTNFPYLPTVAMPVQDGDY